MNVLTQEKYKTQFLDPALPIKEMQAKLLYSFVAYEINK